jgi:hypothetical protein
MHTTREVRAMLPREDYWRELASLAVWWSLWSLADTYLLPWTPVFELVTVSAVSLGFLVHRIRDRVRERRALAEQVLQEFA